MFALPFAALALGAAAPRPVAAPVPAPPSILAPADVAAVAANHLFLQLSNGRTVEIVMRPDLAPQGVARIQTLVRRGFYNGLKFHRVIPGFMAQGGDPKGDGSGGSELPDVKAEFTSVPFLRGMFGAARSDSPDSANSQFFIMLGRTSSLDNNYTVLGRVVAGMDAVDAIAPGEPPENPTTIVRAWLGDGPPPPIPAPAPVAAPAPVTAPPPPPAG
ncbi:MAG: peptidylprolyl isomerase [Sphingomonas sp.]|nr:peptidylprolyl isomerase [Sphingomonas sp.]